MAEDVPETLKDYIEDAHAMEENSLQMINSMLEHTEVAEMRETLEHHVEETKQHRNRLQSKLESSSETRAPPSVEGHSFRRCLEVFSTR
jgi:ferritin-like metal-binding protein YciE